MTSTKMISILLLVSLLPLSAFGFMPASGRGVSRETKSLQVRLNVITQVAKPISPEDSARRRARYTEVSRKYRRTTYDQDQWLKHRRSDRFLENLTTLLDSGVVRALQKEVSLIGGTAVFVVVWNALLVAGYDDFGGTHHSPIVNYALPLVSLPIQPFSLSNASLGLLLVFRTNTSYFRWNEARTAWGAIINNCRSIVRLAGGWTELKDAMSAAAAEPGQVDYGAIEKDQDDKLRRVSDAVWAFPRSLMRHLLSPQEDEEDYKAAINARIEDKEFVKSLEVVRHRPTRALFEISCAIRELPNMSVLRQVEIEKDVTALCNALGACERIFGSPVPLVYTRHTARFLALWLFLLPLGMYTPFAYSWNHWGMIPASITISIFMLGIEELAVQLEEPFSILPMQKMTDGIGLSVNEHVDWHFEDEERVFEETEQQYEQEIHMNAQLRQQEDQVVQNIAFSQNKSIEQVRAELKADRRKDFYAGESYSGESY